MGSLTSLSRLLTIGPAVLPLAAALMLLFLPLHSKGRHVYVFFAAVAVAALSIAGTLLPESVDTVTVWRVAEDLSIAFRLDVPARVFSALASAVWLTVTLYAFEYLRRRPPEGRFFVFFLAALGSLIGVACAANFLTLYMFYELMTFMTLPLVMHSQQREAIRGTVKYLLYSLAGAALSLGGFCFFHACGVPTEFTPGGVLDAANFANNPEGMEMMLTVTFMTMLGFGAKAGVVPLHAWLPAAHPVAPTPASAVLSALITKGGVIGMFRVAYFIAGPDFLRGTWVQKAMMGLALLTIFMGSMMAYVEKHLKKRIAWSSVSQVSYVVFAMMLFTPEGLTGALLQMVAHALAKSCLFLSAGVVIYFTLQGANYHYADQLRGVGKELPVTMTCFAVSSLSLIGLPPTGGFVAKWFMVSGALPLGAAGYTAIAILMISALLTAGYLLPIVADAFFPGEDYDYASVVPFHMPMNMRLPLLLLSLGALLSGIFAGPLARCFERFAAALF